MANCPPYGCADDWADIGEGELCFSRKVGGINAAIIFKCGVTREDVINSYNNDELDNDKIEALIANNQAKLIPGVQITINEPSELTAPSGDPCVGDSAINYDRSLTWQDYNVTRARNEFYNTIGAAKGVKFGGLLLKHCQTNMLTFIEGDVKFNGGRNSPEQSAEAQLFQYNVTWRNVDNDEIFEQEIDVFG
jgi:hypothetical protein